MKQFIRGRLHVAAVVLMVGLLGVAELAHSQDDPIIFSVIGDVPYSEKEKTDLQQHIENHNIFSPSEFLVHLGDIKSQKSSCIDSWYRDVADILKSLAAPVYIVPGDNEWNDCDDPDQAWLLWMTYFLEFEQNFCSLKFEQNLCGTQSVESQAVRPENFAFVQSGVLFVGINKVGGAEISAEETQTRLQQDADWVTLQFQEKVNSVRGAVVFAQASPSRNPFLKQFRAAAANFAKPVLYIHGDGHSWIQDWPYPEQNILRVQVEKGTISAPPVQVTVTLNDSDMFLFERDPWPSGSVPFNRGPCVDAGPDLVTTLGSGVDLAGTTTDDGVPLPANLIVSWSQADGPGSVFFDDSNSPITRAQFTDPGIYELLLKADDGEISAIDSILVDVQGDFTITARRQ